MDSEEFNGADTAPEPEESGPGAALRAAREAQRLDLTHIAAETRIPLRHLQAIEADDFESLPSRAYAIGFSRTYAKAVGLDPAAITDAVRGELADGTMRRAVPSPAMEPGDPARLPSAGLAWAMAGAVLILGVGSFAFYNSYFGAGREPGSLLTPAPAASAPAPAASPAPTAAAVPSGPVVLTATEDNIWVRIYEEGGERLTERYLKKGETLEVPPVAVDPQINTGRPDALAVTIGGQPVAPLSDRAVTISGVPVSAAALAARGAASATAAAMPAAGDAGPAARPQRRREPAPAPVTESAPAPAETAAPPEAAPPPAGDPVPATRR
jgi:cytoskeletal protein RodZ